MNSPLRSAFLIGVVALLAFLPVFGHECIHDHLEEVYGQEIEERRLAVGVGVLLWVTKGVFFCL